MIKILFENYYLFNNNNNNTLIYKFYLNIIFIKSVFNYIILRTKVYIIFIFLKNNNNKNWAK